MIEQWKYVIFLFFILVRSSSTEPPSGGDPEPGPVYIEKEGRSRGYGEACSVSNVTMESLGTSSKQRRDKANHKTQQDEEEERGKIHILNLHSILSKFLFFLFRNNQSLRW